MVDQGWAVIPTSSIAGIASVEPKLAMYRAIARRIEADGIGWARFCHIKSFMAVVAPSVGDSHAYPLAPLPRN